MRYPTFRQWLNIVRAECFAFGYGFNKLGFYNYLKCHTDLLQVKNIEPDMFTDFTWLELFRKLR